MQLLSQFAKAGWDGQAWSQSFMFNLNPRRIWMLSFWSFFACFTWSFFTWPGTRTERIEKPQKMFEKHHVHIQISAFRLVEARRGVSCFMELGDADLNPLQHVLRTVKSWNLKSNDLTPAAFRGLRVRQGHCIFKLHVERRDPQPK